MLRDRRLTLRNQAALASFIVEVTSDMDLVLYSTNVGDGKPYSKVADHGALYALGTRDEA